MYATNTSALPALDATHIEIDQRARMVAQMVFSEAAGNGSLGHAMAQNIGAALQGLSSYDRMRVTENLVSDLRSGQTDTYSAMEQLVEAFRQQQEMRARPSVLYGRLPPVFEASLLQGAVAILKNAERGVESSPQEVLVLDAARAVARKIIESGHTLRSPHPGASLCEWLEFALAVVVARTAADMGAGV